MSARSKAWVPWSSLAGNAGSNPAGGPDVSCECCVLLGRGLCHGPDTRKEETYRVCVCVCVSLSVISCNINHLHLHWIDRKWSGQRKKEKINKEQKLYLIPCGDSGEGFHKVLGCLELVLTYIALRYLPCLMFVSFRNYLAVSVLVSSVCRSGSVVHFLCHLVVVCSYTSPWGCNVLGHPFSNCVERNLAIHHAMPLPKY